MGRGDNLLFSPPVLKKPRKSLKEIISFSLPEESLDIAWNGGAIIVLGREHLYVTMEETVLNKETSWTDYFVPRAIGFNQEGVVNHNATSGALGLNALLPEEDFEMSYSVIGDQGLEDDLAHAFPVRQGNSIALWGMDNAGRLYRTDINIKEPDLNPRWRWEKIGENDFVNQVFAHQGGLFVSHEQDGHHSALCLYPDDSHRDLETISEEINSSRQMVFLGREPLFFLRNEILFASGERFYQNSELIKTMAVAGPLLAVLDEKSLTVLRDGRVIARKALTNPCSQVALAENRVLLIEDGIPQATLLEI